MKGRRLVWYNQLNEDEVGYMGKKDDEMICYCSNVTRGQIIEALENGAENLNDIKKMTGACTLRECKTLSPRKT